MGSGSPEQLSDAGYRRDVLIEVVIYHYRESIKGCSCGWSELGRSWAEHVADVYEAKVRDLTPAGDSAVKMFMVGRCICGPDSTGESIDERPDCPMHGVDA